MLNVLVLMGRITKNPDSKKVGETTIVNFDIAVDNIRKDANGERGTTFLPVVCFNNIGENVVNHLQKGSKIALRGAIQQRHYLKKDGSKASVYEVIADSIEFLDPKPVEQTPEEVIDGIVEEYQELEKAGANEEPKFDPYTGKPLKESKK